MKLKGTVILGAIFVGLAAYVYFIEIRGTERREQAEREAEAVLSFTKEEVAELKLTFPNRRIQCVRDSADLWRLVEPIETEGSRDDIEGILTSLKNATIRRTMADSVDRLSDYGLDEPQVTVSIRQKNEGFWSSLKLGDKNPTGSYVYVQKENDPTVFLVSISLLNAIDKNLQDLRFKKVLEFERGEVNRLSLTRSGEELVCSKFLDQWMLEKPIQARAEGDEIDEILRKLYDAEVREFVAEETEDTLYGLDRPLLTVDLSVGETRAIKRLIVGTSKGETYYARDASRDPVFTVDSSLVSALEVGVFDVRDKSILTFKPYQVREIRLQTEKLTLRCLKDSTETWHIIEPIQVRADESKINDLLWDLEGLEAEEFVTDAPKDLDPYGLAEPKFQIHVWLETDSTLLSCGEKRGDQVYVKSNTAPSIYLVDSDVIEHAEKEVSDFRDSKILNFYTYQVREIEIVHADETSHWKKDSKGDWKGLNGRSVTKSDMNELLNDLQGLKAVEFVDEDPPNLTHYGLAPPRYSLTLTFEGKPPQVLYVGAEKNEKVYVKNKESDSIFMVDHKSIDKVRSLSQEQEEET